MQRYAQAQSEELKRLSNFLNCMSVPFVTLENGSARPLSITERVMEAMVMERQRAETPKAGNGG